VVGTKSMLCEAEIVLMMDEVLTELGITDFTIKINHRGILAGIAEVIGQKGREAEICVAIDKLDKIGKEGVEKELMERGISNNSIAALDPILNLQGDNITLINSLSEILKDSAEGNRGLKEINEVFEYLSHFQVKNAKINLDIALARGLSYYTGCIFEVKVNNVNMGSISGGGRYDNLTGMFGLPDVSGVGFSFGVDRIYDVMEELNLFRASSQTITQLLICNFDKVSENYSLPLLQQFRNAGIATELYPEPAKLKKQMTYADQKKIPYVLLVGSEEMQSGLLQLKNMQTGEQSAVNPEGIISKLLEI
jgi:histidyl-tRNA synthetase